MKKNLSNSKTTIKVVLGGDHAGFSHKEKIATFLKKNDIPFEDFGCFSSESVDYPDYSHKVATAVSNKDAEFGILVCNSGQGVMMTANKHKDVRAALCWNPDIAHLSRSHNDANILCISQHWTNIETVEKIIIEFLTTPFEGGRHKRRVNKIDL